MDSFAPRGRVVLPLMVVGGFAAVVIGERLQLWRSGQVGAAVGLLLALPLACAGLGAVGERWVSELDRTLAVRLLVGVAALFGAWGFVVAKAGAWSVLMEAGFVVLLLAPALVGLTLLTLRPRARAGSLLARAGDRVRWCVVGGVGLGGAVLALPDWHGLREFYASSTLVVWVTAGAGILTLALCVVSSARDLRRARRACDEEASLQPVAAGRVSSSTRLLDIGVGDRMLGEVTVGGSAYRATEEVASVIVGDPGLGASRLARAHRRLLWGCGAAGASVAVAAICAVATPSATEGGHSGTAGKSAGNATAASEEQTPHPVSESVPRLQTLTTPGIW